MSALWNDLKNFFELVVSWFTPDDTSMWDMAYSSMILDGYTDFDARQSLGPRPEPKHD